MAQALTGAERQARYRRRHRLAKLDVEPRAAKLLKTLRKRTGATNAVIVTAALELAVGMGPDWRPKATLGDSGSTKGDPSAKANEARRLLLARASKLKQERWELMQSFVRQWMASWYDRSGRSPEVPLDLHWEERQRFERATSEAAARFFRRKKLSPAVVKSARSGACLLATPLWDRGWTVADAESLAPDWWQIVSCAELMKGDDTALRTFYAMGAQGVMKNRTYYCLSAAGLTAADLVPLDPGWWEMLNKVECWSDRRYHEKERKRWLAVAGRLEKDIGVELTDRDTGRPKGAGGLVDETSRGDGMCGLPRRREGAAMAE